MTLTGRKKIDPRLLVLVVWVTTLTIIPISRCEIESTSPSTSASTSPLIPYVNELTGVWLPWPCAYCNTPLKCKETWNRMWDQTVRIAFEDHWTADQFATYMIKQRKGYRDCLGNLPTGTTP